MNEEIFTIITKQIDNLIHHTSRGAFHCDILPEACAFHNEVFMLRTYKALCIDDIYYKLW